MPAERRMGRPMDVFSVESYQDILQALRDGDRSLLTSALRTAGVSEVDPSYSLARGRSVDVLLEGQRVLIYMTNSRDEEATRLIHEHHIPTFPTIPSLVTADTRAVTVPYGSRSLFHLAYSEARAAQGYSGSVEILFQLGKHLGTIQREIGMLPEDVSLGSVAFVNGDESPIRLVPPLAFSRGSSIDSIMDGMQKELRGRHAVAPSVHIQSLQRGFLETR